MARRSTIPGNFSHTSLGRDYHTQKGWRRFYFSDSRCRLQNDQGVTVSSSDAAPCSVDESSGNTVITFLTAHDGAGSLFTVDGFVGGIPLLTDEGSVLTFGKPFTLKTMIELVSISGDHSDTSGEDMTQPCITMGLTMETGVDFANDTSRHIGSGVQIGARSSSSETVGEDAKYFTEQTADSGSGGQIRQSAVTSDNCKLYITEFQVGPDMSTSDGNTRILRQAFKASGDDYATPTNTMTDLDGTNHSGFNNANTEVTLYAAIADVEQDAFSGNTACVVTCRLWYMVEGDFYNGFGGSGSA